jgi:hypothetical protein
MVRVSGDAMQRGDSSPSRCLAQAIKDHVELNKIKMKNIFLRYDTYICFE